MLKPVLIEKEKAEEHLKVNSHELTAQCKPQTAPALTHCLKRHFFLVKDCPCPCKLYLASGQANVSDRIKIFCTHYWHIQAVVTVLAASTAARLSQRLPSQQLCR